MNTRYSKKIKGNAGNYNWAVLFDIVDGYLGINQYHDDKPFERVLLSKAQINALIKFVRPSKPVKKAVKR